MKITSKLLNQLNACAEGTNFFRKFFYDGIELENYAIDGDYNDYFKWLVNLKIKYDAKGNLIYKKDSGGYERFYKYDEEGNLIYKKDSGGYEWVYKYDEEGNLIYKKYPDGYKGNEWFYKYDENILSSIKKNGKEILRIRKKEA